MRKKVIRFSVLGIAAVCVVPLIFAGWFALDSGHYGRLLEVAERSLKGWVGLIVLAFAGYGIWLLISSMLKKLRSK